MKKYLLLKKRIKKNEGFSNKKYKDVLGYTTIGYGHLVTSKEKNISFLNFSKKNFQEIFDNDFKKAVNDFNKHYKKNKFNKNIEEVLIEMIFQLGISGQLKFIKMNNCLLKKEKFMAALEMIDSLWYKQTPKRVKILINILLGFNNDKKRR